MGVKIPSANTGVWVGNATDVAFQVKTTDRSGLLVSNAARYGVYVANAGETGVFARTLSEFILWG